MRAEHVLLLAYDPHTGRRVIPASEIDMAIGGAMLGELIDMGKVEAGAPHRLTKNRRVMVLDTTSTGDEILDEALGRLAGRRPATTHSAVERIAKKARPRLLSRLVAQGSLEMGAEKIAGVISVTTWRPTSAARVEDLKHRLRQVLTGTLTPTPDEAAVISLLHGLRRTWKVLGDDHLDRRAVKEQAAKIAQGDTAGTAVRAVVDAAVF